MATTSKKPASKKTKTAPKKSAATTKKTTAKKVTKTSVIAATKKVETVKKPVTKKVVKAPGVFDKLRQWNFGLAFVNAVQAGLILWLAKSNAGIEPVTTNYLTRDSLASTDTQTVFVSATHRLFDVHLSWLIAAFFIVSALAHLSLATWLRRRYEREAAARVNRTRWITYCVGSSIVLVTVALLTGVSDIATLFAVVVLTAIAQLVCLSIEHYLQNGAKSRLVFAIAAIAAVAPWAIFAVYLFSAHQYGEGSLPGYVYGLFATGLLVLAIFAYNMRMQVLAKGRWSDYLFTERNYMIIATLANAAIAWQVYSALLKK